MLAPRIFAFARTIRCAIVVSGTRNARAISGASSPPSSRNVKRDPGLGGEGGVAAREDQPEPVVGYVAPIVLGLLSSWSSSPASA